jgi:hypothetical protein
LLVFSQGFHLVQSVVFAKLSISAYLQQLPEYPFLVGNRRFP